MQIRRSPLIAIMDEADIAVVLASFATILGETRYFAVVLLNGSARSIARSQL